MSRETLKTVWAFVQVIVMVCALGHFNAYGFSWL